MSSTVGARKRGRPRKIKNLVLLTRSKRVGRPKYVSTPMVSVNMNGDNDEEREMEDENTRKSESEHEDVVDVSTQPEDWVCVGSQRERYKALMSKATSAKTDEDFIRGLLDTWESKKSMKKNNAIIVGATTYSDFNSYKQKMKKTPDECMRLLLRSDLNPGETCLVLKVSADVLRAFDTVKSGLKVNNNKTLQHLLNVRERYLKMKNGDLSGIDLDPQSSTPRPTPATHLTRSVITVMSPKSPVSPLVLNAGDANSKPVVSEVISASSLVPAMRGAVREEMLRLASEGLFTHVVENTVRETKPAVTLEGGSSHNSGSPDSGGKKRSRKSQPHRVVMGNSALGTGELGAVNIDLTETDTGMDESCEVQYNYVINGSQATGSSLSGLGILGTQQVLTPDTLNTLLLQQTATQGATGIAHSKPVLTQALTGSPSLVPKFVPILPASGGQACTSTQGTGSLWSKEKYNIVKDENGRLKCPYCAYQCMNMTRMRGHCAMHVGKGLKCSFCAKTFNEKKKLDSHIRCKHEKHNPLKCEFCNKVFVSKSGLKFHEKIHMKSFKFWCDSCAEGFASVQLFENHVSSHQGDCPFKCHMCDKQFYHLQPFIIHRRYCTEAESPVKLNCDMCEVMFSVTEELDAHMINTHPDLSTFKCDCNQEFKSLREYDDHKQVCKEKLLNIIRRETGHLKSEPDGLNDIEIVKVESLQENDADLTDYLASASQGTGMDLDENSSDSIQIMNVESGEQFSCEMDGSIKTEDGQQACPHCSFKSNSAVYMKRHILAHKAKRYRCNKCEKTFVDRRRLRIHECSRTWQERYRCNECNRSFSSKGGIAYHQQTKHNNAYKYKCDTCDKGFNTWQHFVGHRNSHSGVRPFVCDKCNIGFSYPSVLTSHKRVCKGRIDGMEFNGLDLFPCKDCSSKFSTLNDLQTHMNTFHSSAGLCKYLCECGERFELKAMYDFHKVKNACRNGTDRSADLIIQDAIANEPSVSPVPTASPTYSSQPVFPN